mmetsp:Transcript_45769/g.115358  ORF Transcript_45769/g.115358 Transcript_45769/m.115358 type:complete len:96 (-) Transcript_45769:1361-1648(-)
MFETHGDFCDFKNTTKQDLGLLKSPRLLENNCQIVQNCQCCRMHSPQNLFTILQCSAQESLGLFVFTFACDVRSESIQGLHCIRVRSSIHISTPI